MIIIVRSLQTSLFDFEDYRDDSRPLTAKQLARQKRHRYNTAFHGHMKRKCYHYFDTSTANFITSKSSAVDVKLAPVNQIVIQTHDDKLYEHLQSLSKYVFTLSKCYG